MEDLGFGGWGVRGGGGDGDWRWHYEENVDSERDRMTKGKRRRVCISGRRLAEMVN